MGDPAQYSLKARFINREFIGQKGLNTSTEISITGQTIQEILNLFWDNSVAFIKREVLIEEDIFTWAPQENPTRQDIGKFLVLQNRGNRKTFSMDQVNSALLTKLRDKEVNVYVYTYGTNICNKAIHSNFESALLIPEQRDRAQADSTVALMDMVSQLKEIHSTHYSSNHANWVMWANFIQSTPPNVSRDRLMNECPPVHLLEFFRAVPLSENEQMQSTSNGLQITGNMIDTIRGQLGLMRQDFQTMRSNTERNFELMEWRMQSVEDILLSNSRLIEATNSSLRPQANTVSYQQESLVNDCDDVDHAAN